MKSGTEMLLVWESIADNISEFVESYGEQVDELTGLPVMARVCAVAGGVSGLIAAGLLSEPRCLQRLVNDIEMPDRHGL